MKKLAYIEYLVALLVLSAGGVLCLAEIPFPTWERFIGALLLVLGGVFITRSIYHDMYLTESSNKSQKELLDRIVKEFNTEPTYVIDMTFQSNKLRDAMCEVLSAEVFIEFYRKASELSGEPLRGEPTLRHYDISSTRIGCDGKENVCTENVQVDK
jgi:hypothetical protein